MARSDPVLWLHHALNLVVGVVWVLFLIEALSPVRIPVADYGVPLGAITLFFVIPVGLAAIFLLNRRSVERPSPGRRTYCRLSWVLVGLSWIPSWYPVLFVVAVATPARWRNRWIAFNG